jgi:hypothetical protein
VRKLTYTAFVAFWSVLLTLLLVHWLAPEAGDSPAEGPVNGYTLAEVARHADIDDCWMAVEGRVYDLTAYIPRHPAPTSIMVAWCGSEATEGMRTKGYGRDHSASAWARLERYAIGELAE